MLSTAQQKRMARDLMEAGYLDDEEYQAHLDAAADAEIDDYESDCDVPDFDEWY